MILLILKDEKGNQYIDTETINIYRIGNDLYYPLLTTNEE